MPKSTYSRPCQVETYVNFETQSWFDLSAWNCRFTLFSGHGILGSLTVGRTTSPRITPRSFALQRLAAVWCLIRHAERAGSGRRPQTSIRPG